MKYAILLVSVAVSFICLPCLSYQENCMWDGTCPEGKYNIDFCGNGHCEPFETKDTCLEDCGSIFDLIVEKVRSAGKGTPGSGPFGGVQGTGITLMLGFFVLVIVIIILSIILIAVYDRVVGSIEKEIVS